MTAVSPLLPRWWHLTSPGGVADSPLDCRPLPLSTVSPDLPPETRWQRRRRGVPCPFRITEVPPLLPRYWRLPIPGGSADFPLASPPPPTSTVSPAPSSETRERSRSRRTPRPCRLIIFSLARWRQWRLQLLPPLERQRPQAGSPSGMPPPCSWCSLILKLPIQRLQSQCQNSRSWQASSSYAATPTPWKLSPRNQPRPSHLAP